MNILDSVTFNKKFLFCIKKLLDSENPKCYLMGKKRKKLGKQKCKNSFDHLNQGSKQLRNIFKEHFYSDLNTMNMDLKNILMKMYFRFLINMLIFGRSAPFYFKLLRETDKDVLKYIPHFCFTTLIFL